jgi:hypothetical protein
MIIHSKEVVRRVGIATIEGRFEPDQDREVYLLSNGNYAAITDNYTGTGFGSEYSTLEALLKSYDSFEADSE